MNASALRPLHAWVGLFAAAALAVIGATGAACVLRPEILRLALPAAEAPPARADTFGAALQRLQGSGPARVAFVTFNAHGRGVHRVYFHDAPDVFIDARGEIVARASGTPRLEDLLMSAHHQFLAGRWGEQLAGLAATAGLLLTLSGLAVWLSGRPRLFRPPTSLARRDLLAAHRDGAALLSMLIGFQLLTGAALTWETPLRRALGVEETAPASPAQASDDPGRPDWPTILQAAHGQLPGASARQLIVPVAPEEPITVRMGRDGELASAGAGVVWLSAKGQVLAVEDGAERAATARLLDALLGLHAGKHLGPAARPLLILTGVGLSLISLTAAWAFLTRPKRRYRDRRSP